MHNSTEDDGWQHYRILSLSRTATKEDVKQVCGSTRVLVDALCYSVRLRSAGLAGTDGSCVC